MPAKAGIQTGAANAIDAAQQFFFQAFGLGSRLRGNDKDLPH
jgi:hypothetical protein